MRNPWIPAAIIVLIFVGSYVAAEMLENRDWDPRSRCLSRFSDDRSRDEVSAESRDCRRIVSMAPSITETLFALGLGDRVVGVTRYCAYPSEVLDLPKVGGYHDPNFEAVVMLRPELVVLLSGDTPSQAAFAKLRTPTLVVCHDNVEGMLDSFVEIGRVGGAEQEAAELVADIRGRMERIRQKTAGLPRPKVLLVIERTLGSGKLEDVYVAGSDGFFDKMIALAGGENAYPPGAVRFPVVSAEGVLWMNPDVVLDMTAGLAQGLPDGASILDDWQQLDRVAAVRSGRVHALDQDYAFVHGPRLILLVEDLARLLHPGIDWP